MPRPYVPPPPGSKIRTRTSPRSIEAAERRAQALNLRRAGLTYEQIGQQMGGANKGLVYQWVQRALAEITQEPAEGVLQIELDRLDAMTVGLWGPARRGDTKAVTAMLRIMDRRAKLLGLDYTVGSSGETSAFDAFLKGLGVPTPPVEP